MIQNFKTASPELVVIAVWTSVSAFHYFDRETNLHLRMAHHFASFATLNKPSLHIPSTSNRIGTLGRINFLEVLDNVKDTIGDLRLVEKGASDFIGEIATEEVVERGG
uniref:Uncharacterized protein n=1 Tax=Opuntia streptacantha TaxID=393608 RepID=A0A7C8ZP00_OPUST